MYNNSTAVENKSYDRKSDTVQYKKSGMSRIFHEKLYSTMIVNCEGEMKVQNKCGPKNTVPRPLGLLKAERS